MELSSDKQYQELLDRILQTYTEARIRVYQVVNVQMTETYWEIGHNIVEYEQGGKIRADYGKALLTNLSRDLTQLHGRGFSRRNLTRFRQFYVVFPNGATLSHKLTWSHIVELLKIDEPLERSFYERQAIEERWTSSIFQAERNYVVSWNSFLLRLRKMRNNSVA